ncbi:uncharacterized protein LOC121646602 [Melanotaenia boesemani]|uniref:uncharacterized protein LOC121646602 n=1 Tax=Melanotaenia boesemani TaxID=1250792 RepID=UPI001C05AEAF|nr:uncharacterized protein LOC121646602 [Melanotaenia boesemani]
MAKTFGYRRQEIVHKQHSIEDILTRWPALFQMEEINAEFLRVTAVPLKTKFLAQLDKHSTKLLEVIRSKGGRVKEQTTNTLKALDETIDITIRRECTLKSLMIYLGEPVHHLIKEYQDLQENEAGVLEQETMAIFVTGKEDSFHSPKDIKIVIDGTPVLNEVPSVAKAVAMLFGLTNALNLRYPKNLQYTLEFVQKVLMELGGKKMSKKVYRLSSQLYSPE